MTPRMGLGGRFCLGQLEEEQIVVAEERPVGEGIALSGASECAIESLANSNIAEVAATQAGDVIMTVGSLKHGNGECKPCGFFFSLSGCRNGAECEHCHLCPRKPRTHRKRGKGAKSEKRSS